MKKGLLGSTALVAATAFSVGAAQAADAPTYKLSGYVNFLVFFESQDLTPPNNATTTATNAQENATMFFDVNEAEYHISASGATDNGLTYGLTMQLNAAGGADNSYTDEVYANIGGSWGKLEFGANDGAEDSFAVGAESIMGGVGGFDGEIAQVVAANVSAATLGGPSIAGDTGDSNKITYYSPDFSGFKLGVSYTPNIDQDGKLAHPATAGEFVDSIGVGAQYSGNVGGGVSLKLGAVYATDTSNNPAAEDGSSWSVGGIVGFQQFQVAASYGDSGDSHQAAGSDEYSYWNVGASFEQGPMYLSAGYHVSTVDNAGGVAGQTDEFSVISLTADYSMAPGLSVLAEVNLSSDDNGNPAAADNDATTVILGTKVSF